MNFTVDGVRTIMQKKEYRFFETGAYNLNIIGVRTANRKSNSFDDWLLVIYRDEHYQWHLKQYPIATEPGRKWLLTPLDKNGAIVILPGQYPRAYSIGIHGRTHASGGYKALEQVGQMQYVRDNNKDDVIDTAGLKPFWGNYKTNIHRASKWAITRLVESYSAGCQVFSNPKQFDEFMNLCDLGRTAHGNLFTYTLLTEKDFL